jgi:hypothetical protein
VYTLNKNNKHKVTNMHFFVTFALIINIAHTLVAPDEIHVTTSKTHVYSPRSNNIHVAVDTDASFRLIINPHSSNYHAAADKHVWLSIFPLLDHPAGRMSIYIGAENAQNLVAQTDGNATIGARIPSAEDVIVHYAPQITPFTQARVRGTIMISKSQFIDCASVDVAAPTTEIIDDQLVVSAPADPAATLYVNGILSHELVIPLDVLTGMRRVVAHLPAYDCYAILPDIVDAMSRSARIVMNFYPFKLEHTSEIYLPYPDIVPRVPRAVVRIAGRAMDPARPLVYPLSSLPLAIEALLAVDDVLLAHTSVALSADTAPVHVNRATAPIITRVATPLIDTCAGARLIIESVANTDVNSIVARVEIAHPLGAPVNRTITWIMRSALGEWIIDNTTRAAPRPYMFRAQDGMRYVQFTAITLLPPAGNTMADFMCVTNRVYIHAAAPQLLYARVAQPIIRADNAFIFNITSNAPRLVCDHPLAPIASPITLRGSIYVHQYMAAAPLSLAYACVTPSGERVQGTISPTTHTMFVAPPSSTRQPLQTTPAGTRSRRSEPEVPKVALFHGGTRGICQGKHEYVISGASYMRVMGDYDLGNMDIGAGSVHNLTLGRAAAMVIYHGLRFEHTYTVPRGVFAVPDALQSQIPMIEASPQRGGMIMRANSNGNLTLRNSYSEIMPVYSTAYSNKLYNTHVYKGLDDEWYLAELRLAPPAQCVKRMFVSPIQLAVPMYNTSSLCPRDDVQIAIPSLTPGARETIWLWRSNDHEPGWNYTTNTRLSMKMPAPGPYALIHFAENTMASGAGAVAMETRARGMLMINPPVFTQESFRLLIKKYPTCADSSDGRASLYHPPAQDVVVSVISCTGCPRAITVFRLSNDEIVLTNMPFTRELKIEVIIKGTCSFVLTHAFSAPVDMYPAFKEIEYVPSCSGHVRLRAVLANGAPYIPSDTVDTEWIYPQNMIPAPKTDISGALIIETPDVDMLEIGFKAMSGPTKTCPTRLQRTILARDLYTPPVLRIEQVLQTFCPNAPRGDAQIIMQYSPMMADVYVDDVHISYMGSNISRAKDRIYLYDVSPGDHEVRVFSQSAHVHRHLIDGCNATQTVRIMPKHEYVLASNIHVNGADIVVDTTRSQEIAHITGDMLEPVDRKYIIDRGAGDISATAAMFRNVPVGHVINVDIPYPATYLRHAGKFCSEPLRIGTPAPAPEIQLVDPLFGATVHVVPAEQTISAQTMDVQPFELRLRLRSGEDAPDPLRMRFYIGQLAKKRMDVKGDIVVYTYSLPNVWEAINGGPATLDARLIISTGDNHKALRKSGSAAAARNDGLKYVILPTRYGPPDIEYTSISPSMHEYAVRAGNTIPLTLYIHAPVSGAGISATSFKITNGPHEITCDIMPVSFVDAGYWTHSCDFFGMHGATYTARYIAPDGQRMARSADVSVIVTGVLPLQVVCTFAPPSSNVAYDGSITVMTSGGVAPFVYVWADMSVAQISGNTLVRTGIDVGVYIVSVYDASSSLPVSCASDVVAATTIYSGAAIASVAPEIPAGGCYADSRTLMIIQLENVISGATVHVGVWSDMDMPIDTCNDTRLAARVVSPALKVNVSVATDAAVAWSFCLCMVTGPAAPVMSHIAVRTQEVVAPLNITAVRAGERCAAPNQNIYSAPEINVSGAFVAPLRLLDIAHMNASVIAIMAESRGNTSAVIKLWNVTFTGTKTFVVEDARGCASVLDLSYSATAAAEGPCGGACALMNDTWCYGCDDIPNSGAKYDACGVCNGDNACVFGAGANDCIITAATDPNFAPAEINACVLAGKSVTGVNPPLIILPVDVPSYPTISISLLLLSEFSIAGGSIAMLTGLSMDSMNLTVSNANIQSCTVRASITLYALSSGNPPSTNINLGIVTGAPDIITVNRAGEVMIVNFINWGAQGMYNGTLFNYGPVTMFLIGTGFEFFAIHMTVATNAPNALPPPFGSASPSTDNAQWITFMNDNYATSAIAFLNISLVADDLLGQNVTAQLTTAACAYINAFPTIIKSAGNHNLTLTHDSEECIRNGGGVVPVPITPVRGTEGIPAPMTWVFLVIGVAMFMGAVLYLVFVS